MREVKENNSNSIELKKINKFQAGEKGSNGHVDISDVVPTLVVVPNSEKDGRINDTNNFVTDLDADDEIADEEKSSGCCGGGKKEKKIPAVGVAELVSTFC